MAGVSKMLLALFIITSLILPQVSAGEDHEAAAAAAEWLMPAVRSDCRGTVGECLANEQEFELDSESNRRTNKFISYHALIRGSSPCPLRGPSYYNCRRGPVNPYRRGCSAITRCPREY